ncbi:hypothetical protein BpHYR1_006827 [Brachionus plicatilis]|uniref:Uncharacterized protein n=1 Tax=Brachionus plicatilis TaxID=10195 RepID=A0A3M7RSR9_BRAPC|nr:hypothetical protein BpHYR1_006827 [Brachionus plicatilis]
MKKKASSINQFKNRLDNVGRHRKKQKKSEKSLVYEFRNKCNLKKKNINRVTFWRYFLLLTTYEKDKI